MLAPSSLLLLYVPACVPDAGVTQLPKSNEILSATSSSAELDRLLPCEDAAAASCENCNNCNKRKRHPVDAYPSITIPSKRLRTATNPYMRNPYRRVAAQLKFALSSLCYGRRKYKLLTRYRYHKQKKPYSAISVHVEQLTSESYDEDDVAGVPDLVEVVRIQASGPQEAARALRKKLKYGNVHRQLRALAILDGLIQNGGARFQRSVFSDEPLLERLRVAASDPLSDPGVREKCKVLFGQWAADSRNNPNLQGAAALYKQLPKKAKPLADRREHSQLLRENEEEARRGDPFAADEDIEPEPEPESAPRRPSVLVKNPGPSSPRSSTSHTSSHVQLSAGPTFGFGKSSKKGKKSKSSSSRSFNLEREKPAMLQSIAASSVASTNLINALKLINRENQRVSDDPEVMKRFETCKQLRRQILRYIQYVESDDFLGGLIHANEELVASLMAFEVLDKSVDDDSDSELEEAQHLSRTAAKSDADTSKGFAGLSLGEKAPAKPPRPGRPGEIAMPNSVPVLVRVGKTKKVESESDSEEDEEDPDDPFGDRNATVTPQGERKEYNWKGGEKEI